MESSISNIRNYMLNMIDKITLIPRKWIKC